MFDDKKRATFRDAEALRARSRILSLRETSIEKIIDFSLSRKLIRYINDKSRVICTLLNVYRYYYYVNNNVNKNCKKILELIFSKGNI